MAKLKLIAITPKITKLIDPNKIERETRFALRSVGTTVKNDFLRTVRTWRNKPSFVQRGPFTLANRITLSVSTSHEVYFYVTRGTQAHVIKAVRAPRLRFQTGFRPKTRVRVIGSKAGSRFGPTVFPKQVKHPGTKAREFDKEIAKRRQKTLEKQFRNAVLRSIRR